MQGKHFATMARELFDKYRIPSKALVPDMILSAYKQRFVFNLIAFCDYLDSKFGKEYAENHSYYEMAKQIFGEDTNDIMWEYFLVDLDKPD